MYRPNGKQSIFSRCTVTSTAADDAVINYIVLLKIENSGFFEQMINRC